LSYTPAGYPVHQLCLSVLVFHTSDSPLPEGRPNCHFRFVPFRPPSGCPETVVSLSLGPFKGSPMGQSWKCVPSDYWRFFPPGVKPLSIFCLILLVLQEKPFFLRSRVQSSIISSPVRRSHPVSSVTSFSFQWQRG